MSDLATAAVIGLVVAAFGLRASPTRLLRIAGLVEAAFLILVALAAAGSGAIEGVFLGVAGVAFLVGTLWTSRAALWTLGALAVLAALVLFAAGVRSGSWVVALSVLLPAALLAIAAWLHRPSVS